MVGVGALLVGLGSLFIALFALPDTPRAGRTLSPIPREFRNDTPVAEPIPPEGRFYRLRDYPSDVRHPDDPTHSERAMQGKRIAQLDNLPIVVSGIEPLQHINGVTQFPAFVPRFDFRVDRDEVHTFAFAFSRAYMLDENAVPLHQVSVPFERYADGQFDPDGLHIARSAVVESGGNALHTYSNIFAVSWPLVALIGMPLGAAGALVFLSLAALVRYWPRRQRMQPVRAD